MRIKRPIYMSPLDGDATPTEGAPAPSPVESASVVTDNTPEPNVFEELSQLDDESYDDDVIEPAATPTEDVPAGTVPEATIPPAADAQAVTPPVTEPVPQNAPPGIDLNNLTPEQLQQVQQSQQAAPSEEQQNEANMAQYTKDVTALTDFYTLTEEERGVLESDPAEALPQLAAKMHYQVVNAVTSGVMNSLPRMIEQLSQQRQQNVSMEQQFFDGNPQLSREKHLQDVYRMGQMYRQMNPQASYENLIRDVGAQVMVQHGIQQVPGSPPASAQQQVLPPDAPGGVNTPMSGATPTPSADNMWDAMSTEFEED